MNVDFSIGIGEYEVIKSGVVMCVGGGIILSSNWGWLFIVGGALLVLIANIQTTSHKWIFKWFNH